MDALDSPGKTAPLPSDKLVDRAPEKRQVNVPLGVLVYAGTAVQGTQLGFDPQWGGWCVTERTPGRWSGVHDRCSRWRRVLLNLVGAVLSGVLAIALWSGSHSGSGEPSPVQVSADAPVPEAALGWVAHASPQGAGASSSLRMSVNAAIAPEASPSAGSSSSATSAGHKPLPRSPRSPPPHTSPRVAERQDQLAPPVSQGIREFTAKVPGPHPSSDVLVAILDESTIVVPNPLGVPTPVRVGEHLPSGATLLRVDAQTRSALTDHGPLTLE